VHIAPACAGSDHFGSYVHSLSLHFYKRLFPGLEPMTTWSQGNNFTAATWLPFITVLVHILNEGNVLCLDFMLLQGPPLVVLNYDETIG
jgi:hypothetical protein